MCCCGQGAHSLVTLASAHSRSPTTSTSPPAAVTASTTAATAAADDDDCMSVEAESAAEQDSSSCCSSDATPAAAPRSAAATTAAAARALAQQELEAAAWQYLGLHSSSSSFDALNRAYAAAVAVANKLLASKAVPIAAAAVNLDSGERIVAGRAGGAVASVRSGFTGSTAGVHADTLVMAQVPDTWRGSRVVLFVTTAPCLGCGAEILSLIEELGCPEPQLVLYGDSRSVHLDGVQLLEQAGLQCVSLPHAGWALLSSFSILVPLQLPQQQVLLQQVAGPVRSGAAAELLLPLCTGSDDPVAVRSAQLQLSRPQQQKLSLQDMLQPRPVREWAHLLLDNPAVAATVLSDAAGAPGSVRWLQHTLRPLAAGAAAATTGSVTGSCAVQLPQHGARIAVVKQRVTSKQLLPQGAVSTCLLLRRLKPCAGPARSWERARDTPPQHTATSRRQRRTASRAYNAAAASASFTPDAPVLYRQAQAAAAAEHTVRSTTAAATSSGTTIAADADAVELCSAAESGAAAAAAAAATTRSGTAADDATTSTSAAGSATASATTSGATGAADAAVHAAWQQAKADAAAYAAIQTAKHIKELNKGSTRGKGKGSMHHVRSMHVQPPTTSSKQRDRVTAAAMDLLFRVAYISEQCRRVSQNALLWLRALSTAVLRQLPEPSTSAPPGCQVTAGLQRVQSVRVALDALADGEVAALHRLIVSISRELGPAGLTELLTGSGFSGTTALRTMVTYTEQLKRLLLPRERWGHMPDRYVLLEQQYSEDAAAAKRCTDADDTADTADAAAEEGDAMRLQLRARADTLHMQLLLAMAGLPSCTSLTLLLKELRAVQQRVAQQARRLERRLSDASDSSASRSSSSSSDAERASNASSSGMSHTGLHVDTTAVAETLQQQLVQYEHQLVRAAVRKSCSSSSDEPSADSGSSSAKQGDGDEHSAGISSSSDSSSVMQCSAAELLSIVTELVTLHKQVTECTAEEEAAAARRPLATCEQIKQWRQQQQRAAKAQRSAVHIAAAIALGPSKTAAEKAAHTARLAAVAAAAGGEADRVTAGLQALEAERKAASQRSRAEAKAKRATKRAAAEAALAAETAAVELVLLSSGEVQTRYCGALQLCTGNGSSTALAALCDGDAELYTVLQQCALRHTIAQQQPFVRAGLTLLPEAERSAALCTLLRALLDLATSDPRQRATLTAGVIDSSVQAHFTSKVCVHVQRGTMLDAYVTQGNMQPDLMVGKLWQAIFAAVYAPDNTLLPPNSYSSVQQQCVQAAAVKRSQLQLHKEPKPCAAGTAAPVECHLVCSMPELPQLPVNCSLHYSASHCSFIIMMQYHWKAAASDSNCQQHC
jgi:trimeric autotransporter adhesin